MGELTCVRSSRFVDEVNQIVETRVVLLRDGEAVWRGCFRIALVYKREFELLLRLAGFRKWRVYGGFDYQPLTSSKQEMVWIVER